MHRNALVSYEGASGFILDWMITGFFPNGTIGGRAPSLYDAKESRHWRKDYLGAYGGESALRGIPKCKGAATLEWLPIQAPADYPKLVLSFFRRAYPELDAAWPGKWDHIWYALAVIESDAAQDAELRLSGHDGCRAWWNGRLVFEEHSWHKPVFDLHTVKVRLRKGRNTLLMKLDRFGLIARVTAVGGKRLAGKVRSLTPARPREDPPGTFEQMYRYSRMLKVQMPCRAPSRPEYLKWRRGALAHYRRVMGIFPKVTSKKAERIERVACDGYTRYRYHLTREAGTKLPVHVLIPDKDRFNGR
ncbi:hypothetical protein LCGC14_2693830, partial [marine sediment metagenome]